MRHFRKTLGLAALALSALALPAAAETNWDMAMVWPPGNMHVVSAETFSKRVEEATGGSVKITVHPSGSLGLKGPEMVAAVRDGIVPVGDIAPQMSIGDLPIGGFAAMPGLTSGFDETKELLDIARPYLEKALMERNQKLLYVTVWPGQGIYTQTPVVTKADLAGIKIRTSDKNSTDFFGALGAVPVQLPWGEVVPSLTSGAISAVTTSTQSGVDGKFWEFLKYFNRTNWANPLQVVTVNLDSWNALTPEEQAAIDKVAAESEPEFWAKSVALDADLAKQIADNGITISDPTDDFKKELASVAEPTWNAWVAAAGPDAEAILTAFRAKVGR